MSVQRGLFYQDLTSPKSSVAWIAYKTADKATENILKGPGSNLEMDRTGSHQNSDSFLMLLIHTQKKFHCSFDCSDRQA